MPTSVMLKLSKKLRHLEQLVKEGRTNESFSEYERGRLNGLILALSILSDNERVYISKEKQKG